MFATDPIEFENVVIPRCTGRAADADLGVVTAQLSQAWPELVLYCALMNIGPPFQRGNP